ncbi:MAG: kelch repeat-containing protein [Woeseia sp.]
MSLQPDRSGAVALQGAVVAGDIHVFVTPETGISRVDFYIDNPEASGTPFQIEKQKPWDMAGTDGSGLAFPYDTSNLSDGLHDLTVKVKRTSGVVEIFTATFSVANSSPALSFDPNDSVITAEVGGPDVILQTSLASLDGSSTAFTTSTAMPWLSIEPGSGSSLPANLTITASPSGLQVGTYAGTIFAHADGYTSTSLSVTMIVSDPASSTYSVMLSNAPDRSAPALLHNATVDSQIYVFTLPEPGVTRVDFFIDNPTLSGSPFKRENAAPFDLAGTAANGQALPFNTSQLGDGPHTLATRITSSSGVQTAHANFTVANDDIAGALTASPASLSLAASAGGASVSDVIGLGTTGTPNASYSASASATWLTVSPASGTTPQSVTVTANPATLGTGNYAAAVNFSAPGYSPVSVPVSFEVAGSGTSLIASPSVITITAAAGGAPEEALVSVTTSDSAVVDVGASSDQPWLTVQPSAAQTPTQLTLTVDPGALTAGSYSGSVTVTATGYDPVDVEVDVTVQDSGSCFPVACAQIKVEKPYVLDFSEDHGFLEDSAGIGTGFTYVDLPSSGNGYLPANLNLNPVATTLEITTTAGIAAGGVNTQDNTVGVGIDAASHNSLVSTFLRNVPAGTGGFQQAGLWFGVDEDNYAKLVVISRPTGPAIQFHLEVGGSKVKEVTKGVGNLVGSDVELQLVTSPATREIAAQYSVNGGDIQVVSVFAAPPEFFSFDAAGIDPVIGTRSFTGIFATHRNGPAPQVYSFDEFSVVDGAEIPRDDTVVFDRVSHGVPMPTSVAWGPDERLYVVEMFGQIHALTYDDDLNVVNDQVITALNNSLGDRLALGIAVDPNSTAGDVILWVAHSSPSLNNGTPNSSTVTRLSGPGFSQVQNVITGLPRAIANHAINSLHFGPDGKLYIAQGGNTGAGAPNSSSSEFGDMQEQPLSAAILVADVYSPSFDGSCANTGNIFGPPPCDVVPYATGLRNSYDFVFHTNGQMYATDNGLGVTGTFPPSPTVPCLGFGNTSSWTTGGHNPGTQPDLLHRIQQGKYYGHPDPHRGECVFKNGSFQGVAPLPNYAPPLLTLGNNRSSNGIVEYLSASGACGALQGELIIANYSVGDDLTRVRLSPDGLTVVASESLVGGFRDPLPLATNADGVIFVGELAVSRVTALRPAAAGCWTTEPALPGERLDAGAVSIGANVYLVGGKTGNTYFPTLYVFNTLSDSWSQGASSTRISVENPAVTALNGKLYVFGGSTDPFADAVANASVYDPATNTWSVLAPMPTPRGGVSAAVLQGLIYVVGGMTTDGASTNLVEIYNPQSNTWTAGAPMGTRRDNLGVTVIGGQVYAFGGRTRNADGTTVNDTLNSVEALNPTTGVWEPRAAMPTGRRAFALGTIDGKVQIFGGENAPGGDGVYEAGEEYDPATNSWRTITPMTRGRHGPASATVADRVYIMGGSVQSGSSASTAHESFAY